MTERPIVIVVAIAGNGVIGAQGGLPWRVRADLRKFRALTMGKPIVMGRKTYESIGRPLDGRDNIVVSRTPGFRPEGVIVVPDLEAALAKADACAKERGVEEICVIGGGEIFAATLPAAARLHVTHVAAAPEGDTVFPEISPAEWVERGREALPPSEGDTAGAEYAVYERRR
jgi:dihydrofolate reductase